MHGHTPARPPIAIAPPRQALDAGPDVETDLSYENLKLVLMTVACAFGLVAHFAPVPFPDSRYLLAFCVAAYFAISAVLQYM